jgi:hypothetical protein
MAKVNHEAGPVGFVIDILRVQILLLNFDNDLIFGIEMEGPR